MLEPKYQTDLLLRTKRSETKSELETLMADGQEMLRAKESDPNLYSRAEIPLLKRFLTE